LAKQMEFHARYKRLICRRPGWIVASFEVRRGLQHRSPGAGNGKQGGSSLGLAAGREIHRVCFVVNLRRKPWQRCAPELYPPRKSVLAQ
jgi:hypothetical protein